jgi:hypothetical protein
MSARPRPAHAAALVAALVLGGAAGGCDPGEATSGSGGGDAESYLPIVSDFQNYRSWPSFELPAQPDRGDVHLAAKRTLYISELPPEGATEFPVGTRIVKETEDTDVLADRKVFAMAKRVSDGSYNSTGAKGWEWWELKNVDAETVTKIWSGVGPPAGEMYAGDPNAGCNSCHLTAADNDYVFPESIDLGNP